MSRLLDGELRSLCALQDFVDGHGGVSELRFRVRPIRHEPAGIDLLPETVNGRKAILHRELKHGFYVGEKCRVRDNEQGTHPLLCHSTKRELKFIGPSRFKQLELHADQAGYLLNVVYSEPVTRIGGIGKDRDALERRHRFLE